MFIFEAIRFIAGTDTKKTIRATYAITQECACRTIDTILTTHQPVTPVAIDAVVTQLAVEIIVGIDTGFAVLHAVTVVTVFVVISVHNQVTVFAIPGEMRVLGILVRSLEAQGLRGRCPLEFFPLAKEWPVEIKISAEAASIPPVAVPAFPAVDWLMRVGRMLRGCSFPTHAACAGIKEPLIIDGQSPLLSTVRAMCRRGKQACRLTEFWRYHFIEIQIILCDLERRFALTAGSLHRVHCRPNGSSRVQWTPWQAR